MIDLEPGVPVALRWRKWDGSPHWTQPLLFLGSDDHGDWFGQEAGTLCARPGREFLADTPAVQLLPPSGTWVASFYPPEHPDHVRVYVDLGWGCRCDAEAHELTGIDMDLDVVRTDHDDRVWIDDVDEFAEHRVLFGYPDAVAAEVESAADELLAGVRRGSAPFDGRAAVWLARLGELGTP